jgi:hypothetical protein
MYSVKSLLNSHHSVGSDSYTEKREETERKIERKQRGRMRSVESSLRNRYSVRNKIETGSGRERSFRRFHGRTVTTFFLFLRGDGDWDEEEANCLSKSSAEPSYSPSSSPTKSAEPSTAPLSKVSGIFLIGQGKPVACLTIVFVPTPLGLLLLALLPALMLAPVSRSHYCSLRKFSHPTNQKPLLR